MSNFFLPPGVVLGPEYGTPEWHIFRRDKVTASCFGDVMTEPKSLPAEVVDKYSSLVLGVERYVITKTGKNAGTPRQVEGWPALVKEAMELEGIYHWGDTARRYMLQVIAATITQRDSDGGSSKAMERGKDLEADAIERYAAVTFSDVGKGRIMHKLDTLIAATPDGFVEQDAEGPGIIEVKCPDAHNHLDTFLSKQLPEQYIEQVQGQLWVSGRNWCDFISYDDRYPYPMQLVVIRIKPDPEYIARLSQRVHVFARDVEKKVTSIRAYLIDCTVEQREHVMNTLTNNPAGDGHNNPNDGNTQDQG